jgi:hypothetical protein
MYVFLRIASDQINRGSLKSGAVDAVAVEQPTAKANAMVDRGQQITLRFACCTSEHFQLANPCYENTLTRVASERCRVLRGYKKGARRRLKHSVPEDCFPCCLSNG